MRPKKYQPARLAQFLIASAFILAALVAPTVNRAAGQVLVGIEVSPVDPIVEVGQTKQFIATNHFNDGSQQPAIAGTGSWVATGSMVTTRFYHTATRLPDGSVLVAGGYNGVSFATAERYNPVTGAWTAAGTMSHARVAHTASLLPNGKVLVVGGINFPSNALTNTTDLYDPLSNTWSAGPPLALGVRAFHSAVALNSGEVMVVAGVKSYPDCTYRTNAEIYNPASNSWHTTGSLALARSNAATTLLADGRVLLAGGPANNCPTPNHGLNEAEIYNPATGLWSVLPNLSTTRYNNFIAPMPNGKVLLAGGRTLGGVVTATTDVFDPVTSSFAPTASMSIARATSSGTGDSGATVVLPDGRVLVAGGQNDVTVFSNADLFNPSTSSWTATGSMVTARSNNTITSLGNGLVLVVGGHNTAGGALASAEIYRPLVVWKSSNPAVATIDQNGLATALGLGTTTISLSSGTITGSTTLTVAKDELPPATVAAYAAPNANGWHNTDVIVQLNATDSGGPVPASGVQSITYSLSGAQSGGGTANGSNLSFAVSNEGPTTVTYHATDHNGNVESSSSLTIRIDRTRPTLSGLPNLTANATHPGGAVVTFAPVALDALSGVDLVTVTQGLASGSTFPHGITNVEVTAVDKAGNSWSQSFGVTVIKTLTSIEVAPPTATINANVNTQQFMATGTYTDGSSRHLGGGGSWAPAGSLTTPRMYHTATRLPDGSVLVAGGYNVATTFASAERYFPSTQTWASAGSMALARLGHTATLLPNGKVIVVGGMRHPQNTLTNTTEIYDPITNSWSAGPNLTLGVREGHSAVLLNSGKLLIAAGLQSYPDCTYRATAELYDPATNSWSATGSLHLARSSATTILLANGKVLLAAGPQNNCPTPNVGLNQAEVYDPATGAWTVTGNLSVPRYGNSITVLPSGKVLLAAGISTPGFVVVGSADIYDPASGTFSLTGSMATPRMTSVGSGDNGVMPRLADGRVLFAGGHNPWTNTIFSSSELFDPITGTWSPTGALSTARTNHTVTPLGDGTMLAVGGMGTGSVMLGGAEIYSPPPVSWSSSIPGIASINQSGIATGGADGTTTITATAGAISGTAALTVDRTAPTTTATPSPVPNAAGWNKTDVQVALSAVDGASGTGVQSIVYAYNGPQSGGPFNPAGSSTSILIGSEGTTNLNYHAVDIAGNAEGNRAIAIRIDKTLPFLNYPNQIQTIASSSAGTVVNFFVSGFDNTSGLAGSVSVSPKQSGDTFPIGTTTQTVTATDNAGNTATATFDVIVTPGDTMPPTTTANYQPPNANGWHRFNVSVNLNAFDTSNEGSPSGVNSITYSLSGAHTGGGTFPNNNTSFTIFNEGTTTVTYHATDNRGNVEADRTFTIKLDKTPPTAANLSNIQVNATGASGAIVNFNLAAADAVSGLGTVVFTQGLQSGSLFPHGTTNESVTITDKAGNTTFRNFNITVNKALLSIAVSPSNATVDVGDNQFFQAIGHFTNGPDQVLPTAGGGGGGGGGGGSGSAPSVGFWNIHFTPGLNVSVCGGAGGGAGFSSQAFSVNSTGLINNTQWSPQTPRVNVTGQVTANAQVTLTISCIDNPSNSVTVNLPWQTTSFDGSITFSGQTTNAHVTGWSAQPPMPTAAAASGAATVGDKLFVVGGGVSNAPSGLVQVFDLTNRTWLAPAASMSPREGPGVAALNGYIYAAGGHMPGGDATSTLQRFDPAANEWVTLAPMLGPRAELELVAAAGKLYAIGGQAGNGTQPPVATVEQYDPVADQWVARAPMSAARMFFAAGALNNETTIIVAGGSGSSVELYNIATNTWSATSTLQAPMAAGATIANRFYVSTQCGSFVYRPADGLLNEGWAIMPSMLHPRNEFAVAVSGDVMYTAGGFTGSDLSSSVATFDALSTPPPGDLAYNQSGATCGGGGGGGGSTTPTVQWSSSDSSIAGINSFGHATGNAPGQTTMIATAGGISCATTNSCGTLTVNQPTYLTFTLAPGSQPFNFVTITIVDRVTGEFFDTFDVPIGEPQSVSAEEADQVRILISAPAGYQVSPTEVEPNLHNGDLNIPLLFTDAEPPTITAPPNVTAEATSAAGAVVDPGQPISSDLIGPVAITRLPAGDQFELGTTTITWRATDGAGNYSEATQDVTVVDTTDPAITAPPAVVAEAADANGAMVDPGQAIGSDLVGPVTITRTPEGNQFPVGPTVITWRATDGAGNFSEATQQVTVVDTTNPVISLPGNITVDATNPQGAIVTYSASATDSVGGSLGVTCSKLSGSMFAIGTTTVLCSATDTAGNAASGSFTVLVQAAAAQVSQLIVTVQNFNLQQGISNSLDAKLTNVLNALNGATTGNTTAVCNQLGAFINETNAQSGKKLTVAQADQLIAAAQQIRAVIGCQ